MSKSHESENTLRITLPSPCGYGHSAQVECTSVVDDGPHVLGVFGAGPTSLLLCHIRSRVEDCGLCIEHSG